MDGNHFLQIDFLTILFFLPVAGALFIAAFVKGDDERATGRAFQAALWFSLGTLVFSLMLPAAYMNTEAVNGFKLTHNYALVEALGLRYSVGIDGAALWLILLTALLTPVALLAGKNAVTYRAREYCAAFLLLEALVIGVFSALDVFTFYLFFEASLIPMFLIIGVWGGENRVYAAYKFFLYTLAGSLLFLVALLYIRHHAGTSSVAELAQTAPSLFSLQEQQWLFLAFLASFAVKVPMWPVHTWLPDAHVQAPTGGSVILAGVLLKLGGYGLYRLSLPFFPEASLFFAEPIMIVSVIGIVYGSLVALAQTDMKKLIAYSSVAHMGFVTLGLFSFNEQGIDGAIMVMISHGVVSAALFLCVGVLYDRMHTKEIRRYGGVVQVMPLFAALFMFFTMASAGLPGTASFVGEFLAILGAFKADGLYAAIAVSGVLLGAAYILFLYKRVMFGDIVNNDIRMLQDVKTHEIWMLAPLAVLTLVIGMYPAIVTDFTAPAVAALTDIFAALR